MSAVAAVCVYCASSTSTPGRYVELAAQVGTALAASGHSLVSGGGSVAAMGAVARAARAGGAHTTGVIPRGLEALEVADRDADELVVVADMRTRKAEMDARSDAFLALPGGIGTLEELLEVWTSRSLGLHDKPVVALDPDGLFDLLREQVDLMVALGLVRPAALAALAALTWIATVTGALEALAAGLRLQQGLQ